MKSIVTFISCVNSITRILQLLYVLYFCTFYIFIYLFIQRRELRNSEPCGPWFQRGVRWMDGEGVGSKLCVYIYIHN